MSKKSVVFRNEKRKIISDRYRERREELRKAAVNFNISDEERDLARFKLQALPRDSARIRVRNRCQFTGRPRGVYRKYMISRICLREMSHKGLIPGMKKSSW